jgi:hypothetical protein
MNEFQVGEIAGVVVIILFQLRTFIRTQKKIKIYRSVFTHVERYTIRRVGLLKAHFDIPARQLAARLDALEEEALKDDQRIYVELIGWGNWIPVNPVTLKIMFSLNTYLLRNRGVAADFYLIKDVVERNTDVVENDINQSISLPLYLGLLGTFMGIVAGLFAIGGALTLDSGIPLLLNGVKIAMIASFSGLFFTVINSGYAFKRAKMIVEDEKNEFYTFIQIELLPLLNQNINSTLLSLQNNLYKFNDEFKENVDRLGSVMGKNYEALIAQDKILQSLDKIDIAEFAKANVVILTELKQSVAEIGTFSQYLQNLNDLLGTTRTVTVRIGDMISRTDQLGALGEKILTVFSENQDIMAFLKNHYDSLDTSRQLITKSVMEVSHVLDESLMDLKRFAQTKMSEVQKITMNELDLMQQAYPDKWKKLDELSHLATVDRTLTTVDQHLAAFQASNDHRLGDIAATLKALQYRADHTLWARLGRIFRRKRK